MQRLFQENRHFLEIQILQFTPRCVLDQRIHQSDGNFSGLKTRRTGANLVDGPARVLNTESLADDVGLPNRAPRAKFDWPMAVALYNHCQNFDRSCRWNRLSAFNQTSPGWEI